MSESIRQEAIKKGLHLSRQWRALVHYRTGLLGGTESLVDDPAFFLSPAGKTSPEEELKATLEGMFSPPGTGDAHTLCRFPARSGWLAKELGIRKDSLPSPKCAELGEYLRRVNPVSAALVFPESNINSPASMFGHTLIRLDNPSESSLLSYSVSYAADLPEDPGPLYAFRGVMGGYKGSFTVRPYYEKIKEYSHMEARDIWEYDLGLTGEEITRMTLHIWEMRDMRSDYYFFDENCSFALLLLIEAARPEAELTDSFLYWVLPTDTLRLLREQALVKGTEYRPSKATRIAFLESLAGGSETILRGAIEAGAQGAGPSGILNSAGLGGEDRALALDLAAEYTLHQYMKGALSKDTYSRRYLDILSARSTLPVRQYSIPPSAPPEQGHGTSRLSIGGGRQGGEDYASLGLRLAYHGLMDPMEGYTPGAAIEVLKAEVRHYPETDRTVLERFMLADITSLWPRGNFIKPLSWRVRAGAVHEITPEGERTPALLEGGAGLTASVGGQMAHFLMEPSLKAGGGLVDNYALGGGISLGTLIELYGVYTLSLEGRAFYYPAGDRHSQRSVSFRQNLRITGNSSLGIDYTRLRLHGLYQSDSSLTLNIYF